MINKFVRFTLLIAVSLSIACSTDPRSAEEISKLYDGIFLLDAELNNEPENSLHYIIFYQDSTYIHKYIVGGDTLVNKGKWVLANNIGFCLYDWIPYGNDPSLKLEKKRKNCYPEILLGSPKDDWAGLRFHIDLGYDFKKISKQNADRLGIWEDSITWHIEEYDWEWAIRRFEERKKEEEKKKNNK